MVTPTTTHLHSSWGGCRGLVMRSASGGWGDGTRLFPDLLSHQCLFLGCSCGLGCGCEGLLFGLLGQEHRLAGYSVQRES